MTAFHSLILAVYLCGAVFTFLIDISISSQLRHKGWKHLLTIILIWIFSPIYMVLFLVMLVHMLINWVRKISRARHNLKSR